MASKLPHATRADLLTSEEPLTRLPGPASADARQSRNEVESQFEQLAALAGAAPKAGLPEGHEAAAALVTLLEVIYYLGFQRLQARRRLHAQISRQRSAFTLYQAAPARSDLC